MAWVLWFGVSGGAGGGVARGVVVKLSDLGESGDELGCAGAGRAPAPGLIVRLREEVVGEEEPDDVRTRGSGLSGGEQLEEMLSCLWPGVMPGGEPGSGEGCWMVGREAGEDAPTGGDGQAVPGEGSGEFPCGL